MEILWLKLCLILNYDSQIKIKIVPFYDNGTIWPKCAKALQKRKILLRLGRVSDQSLVVCMISRPILSHLSGVKNKPTILPNILI